ncbi:geranylgeranylglycerol-phosphate geranylgeranyltransferase [Methanogenium sp. S4BF]|uniref:geranylgeranylglycerol-phosphate geranylgeranyltransferase n=1 Tax=Methanogenium sp. S4BF TaxID=1789226 RepID=UPI00241652DD|nr:geranylgeranylglycerol-phosphate geranylgeranyltransferase [Methanogenium sp. S4BF]WFN35546.1 geranylgeranylglycerol-phosphate geranylgeranyltransferase [Methanogenium sp. S4BF]
MSIRGYLQILRPVNALVAGIAVLLGVLVAGGEVTPVLFLLVVAVFCITGAGNAVNDYYDREIDAINRPDRPIPSGAVSIRGAAVYSAVLFLFGIACAAFVHPFCFGIACLNSLLLVAYAARLKGVPLAGNIVVSYLAGSIFLFGGAAAGTDGLLLNLPLAGIVFLPMTAREILKDAEDIEGDREGGARTLPMVTGVLTSCRIAAVLAAGAVLLSLLPVVPWWGWWYLGMIALADLVILYAVASAFRCTTSACVRESGATSMLKTGMFAALGVLLFWALIG